MHTRHRFGLAAGFVALAGLASLLASPELPAEMVSNWDATGDPNGTMPKSVGLWLLPGMSAGLLVLFALLPRIDPLGENIAAFRATFDWFVVILTAYMLALHAGIVAFNLGHEFDFLLLVLVGAAGLFYYCGILLARAKRNWFVGFRTPWTLSNEEVWDRTHALGGRLFKLTAVITLLALPFDGYALYVFLGAAIITALITVAYSYYLYEAFDDDDGAALDA